MNKVLFSFLICTIFTLEAYSQEKGCDCSRNTNFNEVFLTGRWEPGMGQPNDARFTTTWLPGQVHLSNGEIAKVNFLRYNGLNDELYWLREKDFQVAKIEKLFFNEFILFDVNGEKHHYRKMPLSLWYDPKDSNKLLQVMAEGELSFYVYRRITVLKNKDEFYPEPIYLLSKNNQIRRVKMTKRSIRNAFPEINNDLKKLMRGMIMNRMTEESAARIVQLYNNKE